MCVAPRARSPATMRVLSVEQQPRGAGARQAHSAASGPTADRAVGACPFAGVSSSPPAPPRPTQTNARVSPQLQKVPGVTARAIELVHRHFFVPHTALFGKERYVSVCGRRRRIAERVVGRLRRLDPSHINDVTLARFTDLFVNNKRVLHLIEDLRRLLRYLSVRLAHARHRRCSCVSLPAIDLAVVRSHLHGRRKLCRDPRVVAIRAASAERRGGGWARGHAGSARSLVRAHAAAHSSRPHRLWRGSLSFAPHAPRVHACTSTFRGAQAYHSGTVFRVELELAAAPSGGDAPVGAEEPDVAADPRRGVETVIVGGRYDYMLQYLTVCACVHTMARPLTIALRVRTGCLLQRPRAGPQPRERSGSQRSRGEVCVGHRQA
jgi:hypothetical protein